MNPLLLPQSIPCPDCKGTGEHVMGEEGRLYPCGLCFERKTIVEPPAATIARLGKMCLELAMKVEGVVIFTDDYAEIRIAVAFKAAEEKTNG